MTSAKSGLAVPAHTPAPWSTGGIFSPGTPDEHVWVWGPIPEGMQSGQVICKDVQPANAHLICAAPDLLALAKQYASECSGCDGTGLADSFEDNDPDDLTKGVHAVRIDCQDCADIRAIINKAEGRV